ncbi:MAG: hypothetical protein CVT47_00425 [Thermoplasmata archaeon HGW-Thermoplasmata-2]|nr:MAG: hypothetical protein CVT47_00425 [Thermoplasmata archaeon HGW-Thermoplasmata-2]
MAIVERNSQHKCHKIPGANFEFLAEDPTLDVQMATMEPGVDGATAQHEGKEALYILEGIIDVNVEGNTYHLSKGDSIVYQSTNPHRWTNPGASPARIIVVAIPKSYLARALGL